MTSITDLYNNIKALVHQKFEYKTEEDTTLPEIVESYFNYNQGKLNVSGVTSTEPLTFTFTGTELTQDSSGSFSGTDMYIDYGDGTIEATIGKFGHTYAENGTYVVKIYGVTHLKNYCFNNCTGLTSLKIPDSVTSLGRTCFKNCTSLISIQLNWTGTNILTYDSTWITDTSSSLKFIIPQGTIEDYIQAGYPSDKLVESD